MKLRLLIALSMLALPQLISSQVGDSNHFAKKDTVFKTDTLFLNNHVAETKLSPDSIYLQILEKTNAQLSLGWTPYGIFIGCIGIVIALLAIVAVYLQFTQSREYKDSMNRSLSEHKIKLNEMISETHKQWELLKVDYNKTITEYEQKKSETESDQEKGVYEQFIDRLQAQKELIPRSVNTYAHVGWSPLDIQVNYPIHKNSIFRGNVQLSYKGQIFVIYVKVITVNNKFFWIGIAGNDHQSDRRTKSEFTKHFDYSETTKISFALNIEGVFSEGFPDVKDKLFYVAAVRLRASPDKIPITFTFEIN